MQVLKCNKRDESVKLKPLRRSWLAPGIIYGKNLDNPIKIQFADLEISKLMKHVSIGSQVTVEVDGESYLTMLKKVDYVPMSTTVQHIDFQILTSGEKIKTSAPIHFLNKDKVSPEASIQERLSYIEYEVLPVNIVDFFEVDLSTLVVGGDIKLHELSVFEDERYHFITPANATLVSLVAAKLVVEETEDEEEDVEVPTVGE